LIWSRVIDEEEKDAVANFSTCFGHLLSLRLAVEAIIVVVHVEAQHEARQVDVELRVEVELASLQYFDAL
jgi:hypothetical protein